MIGIVGGTFDPVHNGHILPVKCLADNVRFAGIHYVLCARPPHRALPRAPIDHRYRMLELALEPFPLFSPDDREIKRPGLSYTVDTLVDLRQRFADPPMCLILGLDAYMGLQTWHRWEEIPAMVNLIVLSRPGWEPDDGIAHVDIDVLSDSRSGLVAFWRGVDVTVSSTEVRRRLGAGEDVSEQVPAGVLQYIYENELYGTGNYE